MKVYNVNFPTEVKCSVEIRAQAQAPVLGAVAVQSVRVLLQLHLGETVPPQRHRGVQLTWTQYMVNNYLH